MTDKWTDRLSEFMDGDLTPDERTEIIGHLKTCKSCTEILGELRRVSVEAANLKDRAPETDLWPGIRARIRTVKSAGVTPIRSRRVSFKVPQLMAAGLAVSLLSAGSVWLALSDNVEVAVGTAEPVFYAANVSTRFDEAVSELERVLDAERDMLNPSTVRIVEENLAVIDRAIQRAQRALADDPQSEFLREHLERTVQRKYTLLRDVTTRGTVL
ncbi:MAG: zf-HC2 domain-containing protein [Gemmatimonadota bacterium]|nr:zf-HC2 domain-containing protein [Gemmatimonadota bacterium]MDH5806040.1 zf-HC2 domain-containing protein [Gemmatimonadota bacterium]